MKKRYKQILIFLFLFVAIERFCYWQTAGFRIGKITPIDTSFLTLPYSPPTEEFKKMFDQKLRFIGSGAQFYAFETADKKFVVKFLKHGRRRPPFWIHLLPNYPQIQAWKTKKITNHKNRVASVLFSAGLAAKTLSKQTAILYTHFTRTADFQKKVVLIDPIGIEHSIDLDNYDFLIQKKGVSAKEYFKKNPEKVAEGTRKLIQLAAERADLGIRLVDSNVLRNCGFIGDEPIDIDVGAYRLWDHPPTEEEKIDNIKNELKELRDWVSIRFPKVDVSVNPTKNFP